MAINFPDPSASPWYNDPTTGGNGITYEYTTEGYWKAVDVTGNNAIDEGTGNALYVNKVGDNMTGNLTLGTDKITLNATDGTAVLDAVEIKTVAGLPTVKSSTGGLSLESQNNIRLQVNATEKMRFDLDRAAFYFDGTTPSNANLIINNLGDVVSKGSASFAGRGVFGTSKISDQSCIVVQTDDTNRTVDIKKDGSATFASDVEPGRINVRNGGRGDSAIRTFDASGNQVFRAYGSGGVWIGDASSAGNIQLNNNGSATFAGDVKANNSRFIAERPTGSGSIGIFDGLLNGVNTVSIQADGSASFAGLTEWKNADILRCRVNPNGFSNGGEINLNGADGSSKISLFGHDGSARFNGQVNSPLYTGTAALGSSRSSWESYATGDRSSGTSASWMGWAWQVKSGSSNNYAKTRIGLLLKDEYGFPSEPQIVFSNSGVTASNITFNLEPDNPANYTTTTDSEGNETQVYNGPTLDVKERLQTKTAALEAIKTAAEDASITSLADFKSAIATALANI